MTAPSLPQCPTPDIWLHTARLLANTMDVQLNERGVADRLQRIIHEDGPQHLKGAAITEALGQQWTILEFKDVSRLERSRTILGWTKDGAPFVITGRSLRGRYAVTWFDADAKQHDEILKPKQLKALFAGGQCFDPKVSLDVWERDSKLAGERFWFWDSIKPLVRVSKNLMLAAFIGNLLAVGVSLFALQVWDRVIPAQSINTLTVLVLGAGIAVLFELLLRLQRMSLIDEVGNVVDRKMSGRVFAHMLGMKSDARPQSLGTLAAQIREINQIREAFSSSMLSAAIDLPFSAIFLLVIYFIGGSLVAPIIVAIGIILTIGIIAQIPLKRLAQEGLEEATLRNGLIVETVLKSDEIKLQQAEPTLQMRWDRAVVTANTVSRRQRRWRNFLSSATQSIQQLGYISVVSIGAYYVIQGEATIGQVIACSILANRAIAPMQQVSNVMGALQGSLVAKRALNGLMQRDTDLPTAQHLRRDLARPAISVRNVRYTYPETENDALIIPHLDIPFGSKVGVVGRIGSGKSTLLRLLSGLGSPTYGKVLVDDTDINAIHPHDLRAAIGYQSQSAALFRGTVRDNLAFARPSASDSDLIRACEISGAISLVKKNPRGLDLMVNEAGEGLSGGQKQSLLLARTILRDPAVALFDEPTASMDDESEIAFVKELADWSKDKTLLIATHRARPLSLVDHLIVVHDARIALQGPKEQVLSELKANGAKTSATGGQA